MQELQYINIRPYGQIQPFGSAVSSMKFAVPFLFIRPSGFGRLGQTLINRFLITSTQRQWKRLSCAQNSLGSCSFSLNLQVFLLHHFLLQAYPTSKRFIIFEKLYFLVKQCWDIILQYLEKFVNAVCSWIISKKLFLLVPKRVQSF